MGGLGSKSDPISKTESDIFESLKVEIESKLQIEFDNFIDKYCEVGEGKYVIYEVFMGALFEHYHNKDYNNIRSMWSKYKCNNFIEHFGKNIKKRVNGFYNTRVIVGISLKSWP